MKLPIKINISETDLLTGLWRAKGDLKTKGQIAVRLAWIRAFTVFIKFLGAFSVITLASIVYGSF